jgi:drug/metabolite transporter (DMT)-like permease
VSGYRQSSFEPNAWEPAGAPLRPFNRWQWLGVGLGLSGAGLLAVELAGRSGLIALKLGDMSPLMSLLCCAGMLLVTSRRAPVADPAAYARKRKLALTAAGIAAIVGCMLVILLSKGA